MYQSSVNGGSGNDSISISGSGTGTGGSTGSGGKGSGTGYGVNQASVDGGSGDDTITITGKASAQEGLIWNWAFGGIDSGSEQGTFTTTDGDINNPDTIYNITGFSVTSSSFGAPVGSVSDGTYFGPLSGGGTVYPSFLFSTNSQSSSPFFFQPNPLLDFSYYQVNPSNIQYEYQFLDAFFAPGQGGAGALKTQPGNPTLTNGFVTGSLDPFGTGIGVYNSTVDGGGGNDIITISGTTFDIQDALISGGEGNDTFDTGIGQGTVDGGSGGNDLIFLNFFNAQTMGIAELAGNGLLITGSQDNQGNAANWSQTIVNMEQFQVGSTVFTAAGDVVTFLQSAA